jgi:hypothetical protein
MNRKIILLLVWILAVAFVPVAKPQDTSSQSNAPASSGPSQSVNNSETDQSSGAQMQPDTHPLAGAFLFTLGSEMEGRSYFQPEFSVSEVGQTNAHYIPNAKQSLSTATIPMARLSLVHVSRSNEFAASYMGGGFIYNNDTSLDTSFHGLMLNDTLQLRRWHLSIADLFTYLPQAAFGFGGVGSFGGLGSGFFGGFGFGTGWGQINPTYTPGQTILTSQYSVYSNAAIAQASYSATPRTSINVAGSYGTLQAGSHGAGFINGNNAMGLIGLDHQLTAKDTIGVLYSYGTFHYVGLPESFSSQIANFAYGRKITGRLALQLYGGPELVTFRTALGSRNQTYVNASGGLSYAWGRNSLGLYAARYASGGSGVIPGAQTTSVTGSWGRRLTRKWNITSYGGYSRNASFKQLNNSVETHYGYWFGNLSLNRNFGRYVSFFVGYEYQRQTTNSGPCTARVCAGNLATQVFGLGFTFTPRPLGL